MSYGIMPSHEGRILLSIFDLVKMTWLGVASLGFVVSNPPLFSGGAVSSAKSN